MRRLAFDGGVVGPCRIAHSGALDLDHPGTELGELTRGEGAGDHLLQPHHGDAFQRPHRNVRVRPASGKPESSVCHVSPAVTGCASVITPVVMISPAPSGSASGCFFRRSTR